MSRGLDNLETRLNFNGGRIQESRMQEGKLKTLKKALLYSYQAATAVLEDGRMFRCLINPDRTKQDWDDKIISIPFEDICLGRLEEHINEETGEIEKIEIPNKPDGKTTERFEKIGMKTGDVFCWKETDTYWLVYLRELSEDAYFRAEIRRCDKELEINDKKYHVYAHGPDVSSILWHTRRGFGSWSDLNYDLSLMITKNKETEAFFKRFAIIEFNGKPWEVQVVDRITTDGILEVQLKETFQNSIKDAAETEAKEKEDLDKEEINPALPQIVGNTIVYPYDRIEFTIKNISGGEWKVSNIKKANIISQTSTKVTIDITTGRSGEFDLIYEKEGKEVIVQKITIKSL